MIFAIDVVYASATQKELSFSVMRSTDRYIHAKFSRCLRRSLDRLRIREETVFLNKLHRKTIFSGIFNVEQNNRPFPPSPVYYNYVMQVEKR